MDNAIQTRPMLSAACVAALVVLAGAAAAQQTPCTPDLCCSGGGPGDGFYTDRPWPGGVVYYVFDASVTPAQQQIMLSALATLESVANVHFTPRIAEPNYIRFVTGPTSYSQCIGMCGGEQIVQIASTRWHVRGIVLHEVMHALGLRHEHQRPDRDAYVTVHPTLLPGSVGDFLLLTNPPYLVAEREEYDFASLMHYGQAAGGGGPGNIRALTVKEPYRRHWQNRIGTMLSLQPVLSNGDRRTLDLLYPGPIGAPPATVPLVLPADNTIVGPGWTPSFTWQPAADASAYRIQVDDNPAFVSPDIDEPLPATQTAYSHPATLAADRQYWWRVLASNAAGESGPRLLPSRTFFTGVAYPGTLFVDDSAPAGGIGNSWASPLRELGVALEMAWASQGAMPEIRVAGGVYRPDFGSGDRTRSFDAPPGCSVRGGYAGYGAPDPGARDIGLYETVLSGDLAGDDGPGWANMGDNSAHVVSAVLSPGSTVLEGLTIRSGQALRETWWAAAGGGALIQGSPVFRQCTFTGNHADDFGGAAAVFLDGSAPRFERCTFLGNRSVFVNAMGQARGGGAVALLSAAGHFESCTFVQNSANSGGAVSVGLGQAEFINCVFEANVSTNTSTTGAYRGGAAILALESSQISLRNCALAANSSPTPGGGLRLDASSTGSIANSVLWGNAPDQVAGAPLVSYSTVQGGFPGTGNRADDPLLGPGLRPSPGSPCIDAGDNAAVPPGVATDVGGFPRFRDDPGTPDTGIPGGTGGAALVDMGAWEFQGASCYANCDRSVLPPVLNVNDFACFLNRFAAGDPAANCDGSSIPPLLNVNDFVCFQIRYAEGCP